MKLLLTAGLVVLLIGIVGCGAAPSNQAQIGRYALSADGNRLVDTTTGELFALTISNTDANMAVWKKYALPAGQ